MMDQLHRLYSAGFCGPAVLLIETVLQFGQVTRHVLACTEDHRFGVSLPGRYCGQCTFFLFLAFIREQSLTLH